MDEVPADDECSEESDNVVEQLRVLPEKVVAPFLKTLRKRRKINAEAVQEECSEFYLNKNPYELLANLRESFADPIKLVTLLNETCELLRVVTSSKSANLYLTDYEQNVITLCPRFLQKNERFHVRYRIASGTTLAAFVAHTKEYVITRDILGDTRFPDGIPGTDKTVKAALAMPVLSNSDSSCIAVVELYRDFRQPAYDTVDLQICTALCGWVGVGVQQSNCRIKLAKEVEIHRYLVSIAQLYFEGILTFNKAISDMIVFSKAAVKADRCTFYLMDEPVPFGSEEVILAEVFEEALDHTKELAVFRKKMKVSFPYPRSGVEGHTARTGEVTNIKDAYKDPRFDPNCDPPEYRTRSLLAIPIRNIRGVVGVFKLVNKLTGMYFSEEDIEVLKVFANYTALVCEYEQLRKSNKKKNLSLTVATEMLLMHTKPTKEDFDVFRSLPVLSTHQMPPGFFKFDWNTLVYDDEIPKYIVFAFLGSDLMDPPFDQSNLISFTLSLKKAYRRVPYHNFEHAFTVFHFLFNVVYRNKDRFSVLEIISLLIAGLCHDVDHSGVTNSFLELKNDPIAELYEEYPMEEHHFHCCLLLIQANNLLSQFSPQEYAEITAQIHHLIVATNLSFFFHSKKELVALINEDKFDWADPKHLQLTKGLLMLCGEYSANFRTFDFVRRTIDNFYQELFAQGDIERKMGLTPMLMMDRNQVSLMPDYHLKLLKTVVEPCTEVVVALFPNCKEILTFCRDGIDKWKELISLRGVEVWKPEESLAKEKKTRGLRSTVASTMSSAKSTQSDQKSLRVE